MNNPDFEQFFEQRSAAAEAYVAGDPEHVDALIPKEGAATFHSRLAIRYPAPPPWRPAIARMQPRSNPGSTTHFEVLQKASSGDLGFWTGFQVATVQFAGRNKPVENKIRVTEVFKRSDGEWKMVHRHADV